MLFVPRLVCVSETIFLIISIHIPIHASIKSINESLLVYPFVEKDLSLVDDVASVGYDSADSYFSVVVVDFDRRSVYSDSIVD